MDVKKDGIRKIIYILVLCVYLVSIVTISGCISEDNLTTQALEDANWKSVCIQRNVTTGACIEFERRRMTIGEHIVDFANSWKYSEK